MANTRVNIDVSINTSAAARNLRQLQAQINSFQSALNTNNRLQGDAAKFYSQQLRDLANQSGFFNAETIKMRTAASELDQTLSKGQGTMRQFISARFLKDSAAAAQVLSLANARAAALETQFVSTGAAAGGFREAIAIRPLQAFNSATSVATQKLAIHRAMLLQATTSMINFGKNTQWAGRQLMVGFTVPLTIFGGIAGKVFKEIETELVNFKKVYGDAFTPPEELESNIEAVKDLAKEYTKYGIAVKDTIGLAAKAAATGAQNADLIDATRESTRLATLGQMEQNEALETTIALQTAFNISGEELGRTINFLNMVENQTVVTLQDLAAAIPRVAPVIKGLGGSVEDMAVMLAAMREGGVTAAQGANALKSGLASLINPSNKAVEALGKVGINLNAIVQANRGDLMGTVQAFAQALATLDEFGQQQALEKVFGKFQYARLGALFKNIVKDGSQASRVMDTATMSAQELAASAEKELGAIEQATSVKFTAAMEKLKLSIAPIGEMFMKIAIPIINFFTQLAEKFNNLPDMAKKFAAFGAIMIGLVIPAGTMFLGLLMNLVGTLIKFGSIVGIAFKGFVTGGIRGAIESVSQALNYMSLAELDASNASRQLGTSTEIVNAALRDQVPAAAGADAAIDNLSRSYAVLIAQMQQAAALSKVAFVGPGAAMAGAAATGAEAGSRSNPRGPRLRRNMGGTIPGSGNTDTVPAMLTPGEFVINKEATAKNLPLLHSINQGQNIPGFNRGGWVDDAAAFAGMFGSSRSRGSTTQSAAVARTRAGSTIEERLNDLFQDSSDTLISSTQVERLLEQTVSKSTINRRAADYGVTRSSQGYRWNRSQVERLMSSDVLFEKAHFGSRRATDQDVAAVMQIRGENSRAQLIDKLHRAGVPVTALTDDWAVFSRSLNQAANRSNTETMTIGQAIQNISEHRDRIAIGPAMRRSGISQDTFADELIASLQNYPNQQDLFTDEIFTSARNSMASSQINPLTTGLRMPTRKDLQVWASGQTNVNVSDEIINQKLRPLGFEMIPGSVVGKEKTVIRRIGTEEFERIGDSTSYNLGGLVSSKKDLKTQKLEKGSMSSALQQLSLGGVAGAANVARGSRGRIPGNIVDWFSKLTTSINQSSRDDLLQNLPANIKKGLSTSRKKFDITRGSIDPISGGSLKEVSSWSTGQGVGRFMESSRVFETLQNSKFQIAQRSQGMKRDIDLLKTLGPDGPPLGNPYNPFNRKDGGILNTNLTQKDIQEAGGSVWKANKKKVEERILRDQEFVSGHQKIIDDLQESYIPTIYRTSVRRGEKYFDVSDRIVPKDAQKLSNPAASTDILEEKEVALLGAKLSGTPKTRIVEKAEAQMRYDKASEEIKKLRMAIFRKEISAEEAKPMLQRLYDESENMASFVNWGRGREVSYPKVVSRLNMGGMVPGVQHLMAGAKVMPYVRPKKPAGPRATELEKEVMKKRAAASVAQDKTLDDLIFRRDKDGRLDLTPSELLVLLRENPNVSEKQFKEISKYHGSRIKTGMFGHFDKERGYRVVDQSAGTWRNISKVLEERGYPVVQKRNIGGKIFDSTKTSRTIVPGVGNTDTVPAMLTPGEFVINKDATNKNLDILHAINSGQPIGLNIGGKVPAIQNFSVGGGVDDWGAPIDNPFADLDTPATSQFDDWGAPVNQKKPSRLERFKSGVRSTARDVRMVASDDFDETDTGKKINESRAGKYLNRRLSAGERAGAIMAKIAEMEFEQERTGIYDENLAKYADISEKKKYKERNLQTAERLVAQYDAKVSEWVAKGRPSPKVIPPSADIDPSGTGRSFNAMMPPKDVEALERAHERIRAKEAGLPDPHEKIKPSTISFDTKDTSAPPTKSSIKKMINKRNSILYGMALGFGIGGMGVAGYKLGEDEENSRIAYFNEGGKIFDSTKTSRTIVPGVGNTDTVPAALTPGEFVVNKDATSQNKRILEAINSGQEIKGYELGGIVEIDGKHYVEDANKKTAGPFNTEKEAKAYSNKITGGKTGRRGGGVGRTLGGLGAGMALGTAGFFGGSALGGAMGGETGAMVGGIAGSMLPMLLPQTIRGIPTGGILPAGAMKGLAAKVGIGGGVKAMTTVGVAGGAKGAGLAGVSVAAKGAAAALSGISATIALPVAALAAAIVATTYTFYKMGESNLEEFKKGQAYGDALTTSAEDIKEIGTTARQRAENTNQWLDQSESQFIQEEYATKIAETKNKTEKKLLEVERDRAIQERGTMTRRQTYEKFYDEEISKARKAGATEDNLRRLYEQRNRTLGVSKGEKLDFGFDKTFGAEFIKGAGKKDFTQFQMTKDLAKDGDGNVSQAEIQTISRLANAAYGATTSLQNVAELDMASKLAQYVLSGAMTEDQASSTAAAIGLELGNLKIGDSIRNELSGLVGAEGQFAKFAPGSVATELMDRNMRRTQEIEKITKQNLSYLLAQENKNQIPANTKSGLGLDIGGPAGFNLFTQFFSGMADEARRNIGALIEIQTSEYQMLQENIDAVGLAYNDLIAKSRTLQEAEAYRYERARSIEKLQLRRDELQEQRQAMIFGSEENRQKLMEIGYARQEAVFSAQRRNARARDYTDSLPDMKFPNIFSNENKGNIFDQLFGSLRRLGSDIGESASTATAEAAANLEETFSSSFAQIMTTQLRDAAFKKYEDTSTGATLQQLSTSKFAPISSDPIYAQFWQSVMDEENFANIVPPFLLVLDAKLSEEVAANKIGHEAGMRVAQNMVAMASSFELPPELITQLMTNFAGMDLSQIDSISRAFGSLGDPELIDAAYERFAPLLTALGELAAIKLPNFGNKTIIESIMGDENLFNKLGQNDEALQKLIEFFQTLEGIDPELQLDFLQQFNSIPQMLVAMEAIQNTKVPRIVSGLKTVKQSVKDLSEQEMSPEKVEEFSNYITAFIDRLNKIKDPEIKAKVSAEIAPEFYTAMNALRMFNLEQDPDKKQKYFDIAEDNIQSMVEQERAVTGEKPDKKPKNTTGGGTKEDPLGDLMRQLRDISDLLSDVGTELLSVNREAKSVFGRLREEGANEIVIDYLMSMSPEQALKVGEEVLRDSKKLNTLMQQAGEVELARQQNATQIAQSRAKFMKEMLRSGPGKAGVKALSGASMLDLESALLDEEFIKGMNAARGTAQPNKMMKEFQKSYFEKLNAERQAMSSMAPAIVASQAQQNISQTYSTSQLRMSGLSEEEVQTALESEQIMNRVRQRLSESKSIGPVIIKMAKDLYASTQTMLTVLDEGISKTDEVFNFLSESLNNATQQIDKFTIKPLQDQLDKIQDKNSEISEQQRRFSRSMSDLQEKENDLKEEQKKKEDAINESYDLRIESLEKVDKVSKQIEDRQKGQISVADALSRGDIGAAAKAAQEMQSKFAQAKRDEALQAMRDQKEEDMESLKESHEKELKSLTIAVNGELLTREQIQQKIDDMDQTLYNNSLLEYNIQKDINAQLKERQKIEDQIGRIGLAKQALTQLKTINQTTDEATRKQTISATRQTLQLLGGPESEKLIQAIDQNFEGLLNTKDETKFGVAMQQVLGEFGLLMGTIGTDVSALNIQTPDIQAALNAAVTTASTELPNIFNGITTQIENLKNSIDVNPESEDNPFNKIYQGFKKVAARIEKEFAKIPIKSDGGGGGGPETPSDGTGTTDDGSIQVGKPVKRDKDLLTRHQILEQDGVTYKVTKFYDKRTGMEVPHLIKYDVVKKKQIAKGDFVYETIAEDVQRGMTADTAQTKLPTSKLPSGYRPYMPYTLDQKIPGIGDPTKGIPSNTTAMGMGAVGNASSGLIGDAMNTLFGWLPWNKKKAQEAGQKGAEGYEEGYNDHFQKPETDENMGDPAIESVERGQQSKSPAEMFNDPGKYGAQGYVEGFKKYFQTNTDTILGASIIGWFRRSLGNQGAESPALAGIGNSVSASIATQISKSFTELITASLPINVANWLKKNLGIGAASVSEEIKSVGTGVAIGIKSGMVDWFNKPNIELREPFRKWINAAFGIIAGEPSTLSKPIGGLIASGIKSGIKGWFETSGRSGNDIWDALKLWLETAFNLKDGVYLKAKPLGETIIKSIAKGLETPQDFEPSSNIFYQKLANQFDVTTDKNGNSSVKTSGRAYAIGTSILGSIAEGLRNAAGIESVKKAITDAVSGSEVRKAINAAVTTPSADRQTRPVFFGGEIKRAFGGKINYRGSNESAPGMMMGGSVKKFAFGSFVPGQGMTDKVPALLTPGEFVVRKSVAQTMLPQLKAMNSQVYPAAGMDKQKPITYSSSQFEKTKSLKLDNVRFGIPQNMNNSMQSTSNILTNSSSVNISPTSTNIGPTNVQYTYNVSVSAGSNASSDDIANMVMYKIKRFDDRKIKGTQIG